MYLHRSKIILILKVLLHLFSIIESVERGTKFRGLVIWLGVVAARGRALQNMIKERLLIIRTVITHLPRMLVLLRLFLTFMSCFVATLLSICTATDHQATISLLLLKRRCIVLLLLTFIR